MRTFLVCLVTLSLCLTANALGRGEQSARLAELTPREEHLLSQIRLEDLLLIEVDLGASGPGVLTWTYWTDVYKNGLYQDPIRRLYGSYHYTNHREYIPLAYLLSHIPSPPSIPLWILEQGRTSAGGFTVRLATPNRYSPEPAPPAQSPRHLTRIGEPLTLVVWAYSELLNPEPDRVYPLGMDEDDPISLIDLFEEFPYVFALRVQYHWADLPKEGRE